MPRSKLAAMFLCLALGAATATALAAPPGPADLNRSIETARTAIATNEKILADYAKEMRSTVANDPSSAKRREEIRIIKQYYTHQIEALKAKINDDYKKIQEFNARGIQ